MDPTLVEKVGFAIVLFIQENAVAVIPESWIYTDIIEEVLKAYWPPKSKYKNISNLVKRKEIPDPLSWSNGRIRILGRTDDFETAQKNSVIAEDTSDFSTAENINVRKRKKNKKFEFDDSGSSSSNDSEITSAAMLKKPKKSFNKMPQLPTILKQNNHLAETEQNTKRIIDEETTGTPRSARPSTCAVSAPQIFSPSPTIINTPSSSIITNVDPTSGNNVLFLRKLNILEAGQLDTNQKLEEIYNMVLDCRMRLSGSTYSNENNQDAPLETKVFEILPIDTDQMLSEVEVFLKDNLKLMAKELSRIGGATTKDITKKIMYRLFTNNFGEQYSWDGGKGKKKFRELKNIINLIFAAVRFNKRTANAYDDEIVTAVKMWLAKAKERRLNEEKRLSGKPAGPLNDELENDEVSNF